MGASQGKRQPNGMESKTDMASGPDVSKLRAAVNSYGRNAKGLDAARLHRCPDIPIALFGAKRWNDATQQQELAREIVEALRRIIDGLRDEDDRQIAEVILAANEEFFDTNVRYRRLKAARVYPVWKDDLFRTRRKAIVTQLTAALWDELRPSRSSALEERAPLSPKARRAARQLYRYAQEALVRIDAFSLCEDFAWQVRTHIDEACREGKELEDIRHGWLGLFRDENGGLRFRLVPILRNPDGDLALRAYAYCRRYLSALLAADTGRDCLREGLGETSWLAVQVRDPFAPPEVEKMLAVLASTQVDTASEFVDGLCRDDQGQIIYDKWLKLLGTPTWRPWMGSEIMLVMEQVAKDRYSLLGCLLDLCIYLQDLFPEETLTSRSWRHGCEVSRVLRSGICESLGTDDDSLFGLVEGAARKLSALERDLMDSRPCRYLDARDGMRAWNHDSPPWPQFD
ncbi:MAG: hypothetical protein ACYCW7_14205 [Pseudomonadaceae bacterium]